MKVLTLKDFELTDNNHFVAMEYYNLILNRTFLVLVTKNAVIGLKGNGLVSIEGGEDILTKSITSSIALKGDLNNPYAYLKEKYIRDIENENLLDKNALLKKNSSNFIIEKENIKNAYHDPRKKWGMGYYPHNGKVYIETIDNKRREFIILGDQSGQKIVTLILTK